MDGRFGEVFGKRRKVVWRDGHWMKDLGEVGGDVDAWGGAWILDLGLIR